MAAVFLVILFYLFSPVLPFSDEAFKQFQELCPPFTCGNSKDITFPFNNNTRSPTCGPFVVMGCDKDHQDIQLTGETGRRYQVESITRTSISLVDNEFGRLLNSGPRNQSFCECFNNFTLPNFPGFSFQIIPNITLLKCDHNVTLDRPTDFNYSGCTKSSIPYNNGSKSLPSIPPNCSNIQPHCSIFQLPIEDKSKKHGDIPELLAAKFTLQVNLKEHFSKCHFFCKIQGLGCQFNKKGEFQECTREDKQKKKSELRLILGLAVPANIFIMLLAIFLIRRKYKRRYTAANSPSANASSVTSSKSDLSGGEVYFRVPIFSYNELEEATNHFDPRKALGDGGFGTVYYGILRDGREVAVKRLYERNYKRVEQFMNEIQILTRLHHKNLVSLYGCTSQQSRELLLVYEYIPNGTLADHLHGPRAKSSPLSWAIRMTVAVETASSLAYLHSSGIIHRDVKSNNILLDSNFRVKVADFGLSRLFPNDVTHVSTAPQGTPGYVDPEYYQCYQLTDKSDVYSFGVVLIELISSMPAVDISRHRHEINLANLALNRIQKCAFDDLIDPRLGYQTDEEVKTMTTLVAELAFRCLQQDKEMRPAMDEVLVELKVMASRDSDLRHGEEQHNEYELPKSREPPASEQHCHEDALLKNIGLPLSPNSITDKWISSSNSAASNIRSY